MPDVLDRLKAALSDRYRIERELGRGGMATVYLAEDLKLQRQVALKVLKPELAAAVGAERFVREIEIAAQLNHPNILGLHDSGEADGLLYYAMPYVEGESLRDRIKREKHLPIEDALRITGEVADALSHAHAQGIIHRDIKPENILFKAGHAVVTDFGIARAVSEAGGEKLTETGLAVGTPAYMSPEQATGTQPVDARTDVYSLACVLYEMLSGDPPFIASTPQAILARKSVEAVSSVRVVRDTVPDGVDLAIMRALAKLPADRFSTTTAFVEALTTETVVARVGRRRLPWSVVWGVGAGALVAGTALALWQELGGGGAEVPLDLNVAVVLPFNVRGGGQELATFGDGLPWMLEPVLTGEGTPRAANAVEVYRAWQAQLADGEDEATELSPEEAQDIGRRLGAGQVWLGTLLALPNEQVVINADVWRVADGERLAQAQVRGGIDSISALTDQLVSALLPQQAGERRGAAELTTASLPALRAYLEGRRAYMAGQWEAARAAFDRALERDPTFALAAFYREFSAAWDRGGGGVGIAKPDSLVCALRDRLGRREQLLLPCDGAETPWEQLARTKEAVRLAPDWIEAWYSYGDVLFHWGQSMAVPNARDSTAAVFDRALALADSARREAVVRGQVGGALGDGYWVQHRVELAALAGDVATLRRLTALSQPRGDSIESTGSTRQAWTPLYYEWLLAWAEGDTTRGHELTEELAALERRGFLFWVVGFGQMNENVPMAAVALLVDSVRWRWHYGPLLKIGFALNRGRPQEARALTERWRPRLGTTPGAMLLAGWLGDGDSVAAAAGAREYEEEAWQELAKADPDPQARLLLCQGQLWRLHLGDFSTLDRWERVVFDSAGRRRMESHANQDYLRVFANMVRALAAHKLDRADLPQALTRLDSMLHADHGAAVVLLSAKIRAERQDYAGALAVLRRRDFINDLPFLESTSLRLEGDLARRLGDLEGAIEAYRKYLRLRSDPEPEKIPERDQVRQALAELVGETGQE
jgi:tetratricopeptide (TPR) repeat protein